MSEHRAWAISVTLDNFPVIMSEAGRKFDRDLLERWYAQEHEGYFVRDSRSPMLDCNLFPMKEFHQLYMFAHGDEEALLREVIRL
jgi:hypothetical protein